jgi:hypothetical protein
VYVKHKDKNKKYAALVAYLCKSCTDGNKYTRIRVLRKMVLRRMSAPKWSEIIVDMKKIAP